MSVRPLILGKNQLKDENGKGTMKCESRMGLPWELVGDVRVRERDQKHTTGYDGGPRVTFIISKIFARGRHDGVVRVGMLQMRFTWSRWLRV